MDNNHQRLRLKLYKQRLKKPRKINMDGKFDYASMSLDNFLNTLNYGDEDENVEKKSVEEEELQQDNLVKKNNKKKPSKHSELNGKKSKKNKQENGHAFCEESEVDSDDEQEVPTNNSDENEMSDVEVEERKVKKSKKKKSKKEKQINGHVSEDEFLDEEAEETKVKKVKKKKSKNEKQTNGHVSEDEFLDEEAEETKEKKVKKKKSKKEKQKNGNVSDEDTDEVEDKEENDVEEHIEHLNKLKEIDPEFYKFLEKNDRKLLTFDISEDEEDKEKREKKMDKTKKKKNKKNVYEDDEDEEETLHKPTGEFEVASDESDFDDGNEKDEDDDEDDDTKPKLITLKLLREWETELRSDKPNISIVRTVVSAFNSALLSISHEKESKNKLRVDGSAVFNGVLQLCVLYLEPALKKMLGLSEKATRAPHTTKKWKKINGALRTYLLDLTKLVEHVSSNNIATVILKHLHKMLPFVHEFQSIMKPILKRLIVLWSTSDETVRIIAFLCILRLSRSEQQYVLNNVLRAMYFAYVRNSKFVSTNTLASINFMRRSLVEMFGLDLNISYKHCFLYIRQLAIHLRNSLILMKKDSYGVIYNWQYINSLRLWGDVLSSTYNQKQLQPLIYPLISVINGVIKLQPTARYFPLRFHCCEILIKFSKETNVFIPVLPYITETLQSKMLNSRFTKLAMKPHPFTFILRLTDIELKENVFRDEVIDNVFALTLDYMASQSYTIAFPDLAIFCLKMFRKYCKQSSTDITSHNAKYFQKIKQLSDKIKENVTFLEKERSKINFTLQDTALIESWEMTLKNKGTPLMTFNTNWQKTHAAKRKREATNSENISEYNLPVLKRRAPDSDKKVKVDDGPVTLFPSDDDEDDYDDAEFEEKPKKKQKLEKNIEVEQKEVVETDEEENMDDGDYINDGDHVDIVKDLDIDDWD